MDLTQLAAADRAGISRGTIKNLEKGIGTIFSLISALRAYGEIEQMRYFLPSETISPIMLLKKTKKPRQRARGVHIA
jgi:transcriptional regulator with XRE-family HTH domain